MDNDTLKALEAERGRLLEDLRAIDAVLRRHGRLNEPVPSPQPSLFEDDVQTTGPLPKHRSGLREAIAGVLRSFPQGLRPIGVTNQLKAADFDFGNKKTRPPVRVAGELHRMMKSGHLRRTTGGRYKLPE